MRKMALVHHVQDEVRRVMLLEVKGGTYLFCYTSDEDGPSCHDEWFESTFEAEQACEDRYCVKPEDWEVLPESMPGCQHDWVAPVRIKEQYSDKRTWGRFEILENGVWTELVDDKVY